MERTGEVWENVASFFEDRSDVQCQHRWTKVVNPQLVKGPWTKEVKVNPLLNCCCFLLYLVFFISFLENHMNNSMKTLFPVFDEHFRFSITFPLNESVLLRLYSTITSLNVFFIFCRGETMSTQRKSKEWRELRANRECRMPEGQGEDGSMIEGERTNV